jgi:hypothetical protein
MPEGTKVEQKDGEEVEHREIDDKLTQHCEDRGHCEHMCGVQRLPLWMLYVGLGGVVLGVGLGVVWLCVLIVVVLQSDLPQIIDVDFVDAGV